MKIIYLATTNLLFLDVQHMQASFWTWSVCLECKCKADYNLSRIGTANMNAHSNCCFLLMGNGSNLMLDLTILWSQNGWSPTAFLCLLKHISIETLSVTSILQKWSILPVIWNFFARKRYCSQFVPHRSRLGWGTLFAIDKKLSCETFGIWGYNTWRVSLLHFLARELFSQEEYWPPNPMSLRRELHFAVEFVPVCKEQINFG